MHVEAYDAIQHLPIRNEDGLPISEPCEFLFQSFECGFRNKGRTHPKPVAAEQATHTVTTFGEKDSLLVAQKRILHVAVIRNAWILE